MISIDDQKGGEPNKVGTGSELETMIVPNKLPTFVQIEASVY